MQLRHLRNQLMPGDVPALIPPTVDPTENDGRSPAVSGQFRRRIEVNSMAIQCLLVLRIPTRSSKHLGDLSIFPNLADTCKCEECLRDGQSVCRRE